MFKNVKSLSVSLNEVLKESGVSGLSVSLSFMSLRLSKMWLKLRI